MADYWDQLAERVEYLRDLYRAKKIALKPGEGMTIALDEAEQSARGVASQDAGTDENLVLAVNACHVVWGLYDSIKACVDAGLDVTNHLGQLTTGTIDFGVPADAATSHKTIFFKDFEAELLIAAQLTRAGLPVQFLEEANDPRGEMRVGDILIEVKHPNSTKRLESLMRKFNSGLHGSNAYGVFVTAVEDAFCVADQSTFTCREDFVAWQRQKRAEIESFGRSAVLRAASLPRIGALVQTSSALEVVGDETRLARYSNSLVFDQRSYPIDVKAAIERIAAVFNPHFRRFSQVGHLIMPTRKGQ